MSQSLKQLKINFRKSLKLKLSTIPNDEISTQSKALTNYIIHKSNLFQNNMKIGLYLNMENKPELITSELIKELWEKFNVMNIYLPKITSLTKFSEVGRYDTQTKILHFLKIDDYKELEGLKPQGPYSIREPEFKYASNDNHNAHTGTNPTNDLLLNSEKLDILIVPGVAFTKTCKRIGHGAGFYDDFIKRYKEFHAGELPLLVGVGLKEQLVEDIKNEEHDEVLDYVVIKDKIYCPNGDVLDSL